MTWRGVIEKYRKRLPINPELEPITLLEGNTPLVEAGRLAARIEFDGRLYLKCEGLNPTGSFKDRGMTVAISAAAHNGVETVICASTGNTSASAAAYAARAGMRAFVVVPEGRIAVGKLSQAVVHGAKVVSIAGGFDEALQIVAEIANLSEVVVVNSINPYRLQGQKTAAFEICDALGEAPTHHFLPVGNAGNITAYWMGYREYRDAGVTDSAPSMMGFQAEGAAPIVLGQVVSKPTTVASAIRIGNPASWRSAEAARDESGGVIGSVTDREILDSYRLLATTVGAFAEPASAASIAGLRRLVVEGRIESDAVVVCTLTGHGLKDPATATEESPAAIKTRADVDDVKRALDI
jgi:threonine synthase